ncbi:MAG: cutinase family protein, partial [Mycobacterium sp.]|nr:cutinase family protein [Mycobacterium sp.]
GSYVPIVNGQWGHPSQPPVQVPDNPSARANGLMEVLTPQFDGKTIDLCNQGDPICSNGDQWNAHLGYVPGMTNRAANFVAGKV